MRDAVARIQLAAIQAKQKILIYGDYDVDGTVSVVILKKAIEMAGGEASFHVPHRLKRWLRHAGRRDRARSGHGHRTDRQRGYRHSGFRSGAGRTPAVDRCHRHRSSSAGRGTSSCSRGVESQSAGLRISGQEPVRRGRCVQAGARAAADARMAGGQAGARDEVVSQASGHRDRGRRGAAGGRESRDRQAWPGWAESIQEPRACGPSWSFPG